MEKTMSGISIDDGGAGAVPLVFIHSLAGNTRQWSAQLRHLRTKRRAIALNLRGHDRSLPPADGDYAIDSMAGDVLMVLDQLGIGKSVLIGHSMGGSVAGAFAAAYPDRVAGLLLVDPSGDSTRMPAEEVQQYLGALESEAWSGVVEGYWNQLLTGSSETTETRVMDDLRHTSRETVVGVFRELFRYSPVPALEKYSGPKLSVISSQSDHPFGLHNLVAGLPHELVTGTGHWIQMDRPEEFNRIMDGFLSSAAEAGRI